MLTPRCVDSDGAVADTAALSLQPSYGPTLVGVVWPRNANGQNPMKANLAQKLRARKLRLRNAQRQNHVSTSISDVATPVPIMRRVTDAIEELQLRVEVLERNALNHEKQILALHAPVSAAFAGAPCPALTPSQITAEILTAGLSRDELLRINYCVSKRLLHFAQ
jgi:hypothetical protein